MYLVQGDCYLKIQNNVLGESQDYSTAMPPQEKGQQTESYLKEVLDKKNLVPPTTLSSPKSSTY